MYFQSTTHLVLTNNSKSILFVFLAFLLISGCRKRVKSAVEKTTDSTIVEKIELQTMPGLDHGLLQSPINIMSEKAEHGKHDITVFFSDEINKIENLGHTIQLDFASGSTILHDGHLYEFKQIHFHTPAEHLIDGITYPMEMHMVNTLVDTTDKTSNHYLVISMLFRMGKENKFISEFLDKVPSEESNEAELEPGTVKMSDLFEQNPEAELSDCYHYRGSLTTPPYTESVNWYIAKVIHQASAKQIQRINEFEGNNARHIQALYGRVVDDK